MLKTHINFKHTKEGERVEFNCEECGLKFRTLWNLSNHKRDSHGKKEIAFSTRQTDVNLEALVGNLIM